MKKLHHPRLFPFPVAAPCFLAVRSLFPIASFRSRSSGVAFIDTHAQKASENTHQYFFSHVCVPFAWSDAPVAGVTSSHYRLGKKLIKKPICITISDGSVTCPVRKLLEKVGESRADPESPIGNQRHAPSAISNQIQSSVSTLQFYLQHPVPSVHQSVPVNTLRLSLHDQVP